MQKHIHWPVYFSTSLHCCDSPMQFPLPSQAPALQSVSLALGGLGTQVPVAGSHTPWVWHSLADGQVTPAHKSASWAQFRRESNRDGRPYVA